ncbi:unnamed protein product [Leptosia nina]|uniref:Uncharacterized protein n=1 Tax=Leptosia nina TaxID=320188 RepID=A0AAV1IVX0_9NEOP
MIDVLSNTALKSHPSHSAGVTLARDLAELTQQRCRVVSGKKPRHAEHAQSLTASTSQLTFSGFALSNRGMITVRVSRHRTPHLPATANAYAQNSLLHSSLLLFAPTLDLCYFFFIL